MAMTESVNLWHNEEHAASIWSGRTRFRTERPADTHYSSGCATGSLTSWPCSPADGRDRGLDHVGRRSHSWRHESPLDLPSPLA